MHTTRRDLLKFASVAAAGAMLTPALRAYAGELRHVPKAAKPLNLLILGGTGFTGPFQVAYALARGHKVTLFNRGKRPSPEWPGAVEQLLGDRNNDLKALEGDRTWDACIDNPTSVPVWVRDAGKVLKGRVIDCVFEDYKGGNTSSSRRFRFTPTTARRAWTKPPRWPSTRARTRWRRRARR